MVLLLSRRKLLLSRVATSELANRNFGKTNRFKRRYATWALSMLELPALKGRAKFDRRYATEKTSSRISSSGSESTYSLLQVGKGGLLPTWVPFQPQIPPLSP